MKRPTFILIPLALLIGGCINDYGRPAEGATRVTFSDLLSDPTRWKGKVVELEGAFKWELEGDAIFETKEDLRQKSLKKAISLRLDDPALRIPYGKQDKSSIWRKTVVPLSLRLHVGKSAVVTGLFETESIGGFYAGSIRVSHLSLR
jgi:hypothetical protein